MIQSQFTEAKDINDDLYSSISLPALKLLVTFTDVHCSLGKTPVIDAPFSRNHTYSDERADWIIPFKEIADKHKAPLKILRCQPPNEEEHKRRLKKWNFGRDENKIKNWAVFIQEEPVDFPVLYNDVTEIYTFEPAEQLAYNYLKEYISQKLLETDL